MQWNIAYYYAERLSVIFFSWRSPYWFVVGHGYDDGGARAWTSKQLPRPGLRGSGSSRSRVLVFVKTGEE